MEVTIGLARADYEQLLHAVPAQSSAYCILHRYPALDRWADEKPFSMCVIVECKNSDEAIALLQAARQHCSRAIPDIIYALKAARALHLIS
jgi:hypothetical protein